MKENSLLFNKGINGISEGIKSKYGHLLSIIAGIWNL